MLLRRRLRLLVDRFLSRRFIFSGGWLERGGRFVVDFDAERFFVNARFEQASEEFSLFPLAETSLRTQRALSFATVNVVVGSSPWSYLNKPWARCLSGWR